MKRVIIESPFSGATPAEAERNLRYLRACLADSLCRGESPYASHGLYTQPGVLDDGDPAQRTAGIAAGFAWRFVADITAVYTDLGVSRGMLLGLKDAQRLCVSDEHEIEYRELGGEWAVAK